ncbi:5769_t:CDS:2 [Gigaspora margarita]|uniref:5769_t:CDS:1 n=1 Tax=Gigaspora margarita TaxID=4874 RepID=A0ABN7V1K4_GIGMA|nr:5769_t:CDS:2 [Gigaspora margarita]
MDHSSRSRKKTSTVSGRKNVQYSLPCIELDKLPNTPSSSSNSMQITKNGATETCLDEHNDNDNFALTDLEDQPSIDNNNFNDDISDNEELHTCSKQKSNEVIQKKVNEMHTDWKAVGFSSRLEDDTKWIEDAIDHEIYGLIEEVKYSSDEDFMRVAYDAQRFAQQVRSNIVQKIKVNIHNEFPELTKPKAENCQIHEEEQKFKESKITKKCYIKLNKPIDNDPQYTYLNLIIDSTFTDQNTEKNSIVFEMAVALNYLDPSKGIEMVPTKVVDKMNFILERIGVSQYEVL